MAGDLSSAPGYFRLAAGLRRNGKTAPIPVAKHAADDLVDTLPVECVNGDEIRLPFDPDKMADYLRYECYTEGGGKGTSRLGAHPLIRDIYYLCRPLLRVSIRSILQRIHLRSQLKNPFPKWPVDRTVDRLFEKMMIAAIRANGSRPIPFIWFWHERKQAAFILTHDVEDEIGKAFCP